MTLTPDQEILYGQLQAAAQILVTVANNAATVLSEEFEAMITGPAKEVQSILDQLPAAPLTSWDGVFNIDQCDEENFTPDVPDEIRAGRVNTGVRLRHRPTGIGREAYSSHDVEINRASASRALKRAAEDHYRRTVIQG